MHVKVGFYGLALLWVMVFIADIVQRKVHSELHLFVVACMVLIVAIIKFKR